MQFCDHCHLSVAGERKLCPLCQARLTGAGDEAAEVFPIVRQQGKYHLLIRSLIFLSIAAIVISLAVNAIFHTGIWWCFFVAVAVACLWLGLDSVLRRRGNISKSIMWMVLWLSLFALLWDFLTKWRGWSIDYAIPAICVFAMATMTIIARAMRLKLEEYMIYLILASLFGIIPLILMLVGLVTVALPSIICVVASALSLAALLAFHGEKLIAEIKRRLHM